MKLPGNAYDQVRAKHGQLQFAAYNLEYVRARHFIVHAIVVKGYYNM